MKLKQRAIMALILSVILLGLAVLIWANQTGRITIWGAGETINITNQDWQNTNDNTGSNLCPVNQNRLTLLGGNRDWIDRPNIGTGIYQFYCSLITVGGKPVIKTESTTVDTTTKFIGEKTQQNLKYSWLCPQGTFIDSFTTTVPPIEHQIMTGKKIFPQSINCVKLTSQSGALVTWTSTKPIEINKPIPTPGSSGFNPTMYQEELKCPANSLAVGLSIFPYASMLDPKYATKAGFTLYCINLTAVGGATPTPTPTKPTPTPTKPTPTPTKPTDTTPPSAPLNLKADPISQTEIQLTWTVPTNNGVTGYKIYNADNDKQPIATTPYTTHLVTGLQCNTKYRFYVVAYDAAGNVSPKSNIAEATTKACDPTPDKEKPTTPGNLRSSDLKATESAPNCWSVKLEWNASTDNVGVTGYDIYNAEDDKFIVSTKDTNYTFKGLKENSTYKYYVKAHDGANPPNVSDKSNTVEVKTPACPATPTPTPTPTQGGKTKSLVSTGAVLWFNILVALVIAGLASYLILFSGKTKK